ncbi:adenylate/guanylate cyclase domain-containing protein [Marinobacteraceae bacterium S3BR75-40.1]
MLRKFGAHLPALLIALAIILWQVMQSPAERSLLNRFEYIYYDWRAGVGAELSHASSDWQVGIVDIDEESLYREGRWPWSRLRVAELVAALQRAGAIVVAFDIVFSEPETLALLKSDADRVLSPEERALLRQIDERNPPDNALADQLGEGDSVLGFFFHQGRTNRVGQLPASVGAVPGSHVLLTGQGYTAPLPLLQEAAISGGFVSTFPDSDGVIRRTPLVMAHQGQAYPSLALAGAMTFLLAENAGLRFEPVGDIQAMTQLRIASDPARTDAQGQVLVPYPSLANRVPRYPAWQLLAGKLEPGALAGKLVFVGTSAIGLADLVSTPFTNIFPGVEVQALVAQHLISGGFPYRPDWAPGAVLISQLLLVLVLIAAFAGRRPWFIVLAAAIITTALVASNTYLWTRFGLDLPLVSTLMITALLFGWYLLYGFIQEYTDRRRIHDMFGQYVPSAHVDLMLNNPESYSMAGESKELTVLFSDVRSFTTISEKLSASELKALLNDYFTPITEIIFRNGGTIDKYVGDMVMAFWGAPVDDPRHRQNALKAALEMQTCTRRLAAEFQQKGWPEIRIGVGLNTGRMNVGDMGSQYRKAYTVLGDAVNLGSRLEGLTKFYGVDILVGEETAEGVEEYVFRFCDRLMVKGKDEAINAYEPVGEAAAVTPEEREDLARYHEAIGHYLKQEWDAAEALLQSLHEKDPGRKLYRLFLDRIAELRQQDLPADWDGAFRHTSK